jgi:hypothetical protein
MNPHGMHGQIGTYGPHGEFFPSKPYAQPDVQVVMSRLALVRTRFSPQGRRVTNSLLLAVDNPRVCEGPFE